MYSTAIRKLHVSVLPEKLPCRSKERDYIYKAIRDVIITRDNSKPIYISGMFLCFALLCFAMPCLDLPCSLILYVM
jgi:hypothetical protein